MSDFSCYGGPSEEWAAIQATLPQLPTGLPVLERKRVTNEGREAVAAEEMKQLASHVHIKDYSIPTRDGSTIEGRSYRPTDVSKTERIPLYIHLHGGGFLFGTLSSEDAICSRIAIGSKVAVLNVNYRHTPEFLFPTAWHDAQDAFEWAHSHMKDFGTDPEKVVVGGVSAGAQLSASLVLQKHLGKAAKSCPPIAGQVLMIPCTVNLECYEPLLSRLKDPSVSSLKENEHAPILPLETMKFFTSLLKVERPQGGDTLISPGLATQDQVTGLPPTTFGVAGFDPLRDEGLLYAKLLTDAG